MSLPTKSISELKKSMTVYLCTCTWCVCVRAYHTANCVKVRRQFCSLFSFSTFYMGSRD